MKKDRTEKRKDDKANQIQYVALIPTWLQEFEKEAECSPRKKKHRHRYKTIIIDSRGVRHQMCKCGKHRIIKPKELNND